MSIFGEICWWIEATFLYPEMLISSWFSKGKWLISVLEPHRIAQFLAPKLQFSYMRALFSLRLWNFALLFSIRFFCYFARRVSVLFRLSTDWTTITVASSTRNVNKLIEFISIVFTISLWMFGQLIRFSCFPNI